MSVELTECSEMSAYQIETPGIIQKEEYNIQNTAKFLNQDCRSSIVFNLIMNV
jgi:hypothetical protein